MEPLLIVALVLVLFAVAVLMKAVRIVPQARARNVERFGRYRKTLKPGLNFIIPFVDRVNPAIDLREQVVSFAPQPVITEDNLVVHIDTVLFFQVTDPRAADYEIANYIQAVEQITVTMLRNVIGSMDLEKTLTSRDEINSQLRGVLDEATGKWGLRVNRVEIKAIDPPKSIKDAMEKQMRAERDKRAAILTAEGAAAVQILTAEGDKQSAILRAEGDRAAAILRAEGQAAGHRPGLPGRAPQRPRPQAARLPVPADAAAARPGPGQHVLGHPERGHLGAVGHRAGLRSAGGAASTPPTVPPTPGRGSGLPATELDGPGPTGGADGTGAGLAGRPASGRRAWRELSSVGHRASARPVGAARSARPRPDPIV